MFNGDFKIFFRDSMKVLPASLEKLCLELDVPHKKMTETVSHDDITIDNYRTFPALHKYLENACKGLFEVVEKFGLEPFKATSKDEFYAGEHHVTQIFEQIYGKSFTKVNPSWLNLMDTTLKWK